MFNKKNWIALILLTLSACGDLLTGEPRDESFYRALMMNRAAPTKVVMEKEKLIYSDKYPMRIALYEDSKFYYQIDELGDGWGHWLMEDGMLKLFAHRPYFDMRLVLSGSKDSADAKVLRFRDRTGVQSIEMKVRDPEAAARQGQALPLLKEFTKNRDGF